MFQLLFIFIVGFGKWQRTLVFILMSTFLIVIASHIMFTTIFTSFQFIFKTFHQVISISFLFKVSFIFHLMFANIFFYNKKSFICNFLLLRFISLNQIVTCNKIVLVMWCLVGILLLRLFCRSRSLLYYGLISLIINFCSSKICRMQKILNW